MTKLPDPDQWLLTRLTEAECAELIEQHINYVDKNGRSVQLPKRFVEHYLQRDDNKLPTVSAVSTLPSSWLTGFCWPRRASIANAALFSTFLTNCWL